MPESPNNEGGGVVKILVSSNGSPVKDTVQFFSIETRKEINRVSSARLVIADGYVAEQDFPVSNSGEFTPGKEIKIELGYESQVDTVFEGIVVKQAISINNDAPQLVVECRDKAAAMTVERKNANYVDKSDSDIIKTLIGNAPGLTAKVDDSGGPHPELVQYYCTDWDFMLSRAEAAGMLVMVDDGTVTVKTPDTSSSPKLKVTYGNDLIEFQAEMDAVSQLASFTSASWDPASQKVVKQQVGPKKFNPQGDLDSKALAKTLSSPVVNLQTGAPLKSAFLKKWAESGRMKSGLARIRGRMTFQGNAKAKVGELIEVEGVGDHFNGKVFTSAVRHEVGEGNWLTEAEFGISPDWFAERRDLTALPAAGLLPAVEGLQIGVVMKLDGDPLKLHRIQVKVPVLQAETEGIWARLASCYASKSFGSFVLPEVGDEVILGYFNNDPSHPVIVGSLYNGKNAPPYPIKAPNDIKAFISREKLTLELDEKDKVITVKTPGGNTVVISDKDKGILLEDQNGNKVELNDSGISIESPKDIKITAKGKIDIKSTGALSLTSSADLKGEGLKVSLKGKTSLTADGGPNAKLTASAMTTIKGGIVKIN
ncbi:MAG: type VI secretion system tip protein VgrG [Candidatus Electrothrix communis]|nr:MAG: type VI secretion system tip protein VgrG [Candidatus Electrothrix communis]